MKIKKILPFIFVITVTFSTIFGFGIPKVTQNFDVSAKEKVVNIKKKAKLYRGQGGTFKANTKYVYSLTMKKRMKLDFDSYSTQDEKTEIAVNNDQTKKVTERQKIIRKLTKKYYKGNVGTVTIKSSDGKKIFLKRTLKAHGLINTHVTLPKGNYKIEFKMNNNVSKTLFKKIDSGFLITEFGSVS